MGDSTTRVQNIGRRKYSHSVLIVVENRNFHTFAHLLFDIETLGWLDVLKIDTTQRGFQRCDDVDQFVGVGFGQFDIENVDAGEFLEEATLALHDGFGCQRADIPQTPYRGSGGDDSYKSGARGVQGGRITARFRDTTARPRAAGPPAPRKDCWGGQGLGGPGR